MIKPSHGIILCVILITFICLVFSIGQITESYKTKSTLCERTVNCIENEISCSSYEYEQYKNCLVYLEQTTLTKQITVMIPVVVIWLISVLGMIFMYVIAKAIEKESDIK